MVPSCSHRSAILAVFIAAGCGGSEVASSSAGGASATTGGSGGTTMETTSSTSDAGGAGGSGTTSTSSSAGAGGVIGTGGAGGGGAGGTGATAGGGGALGGAGGAGGATGGAGGGGSVSPSALCPVPFMTDLFSGPFPPNPYASAIPADACVSMEHDVIMVLGCPNNADGTPSTCQKKRADMAVSLKDAGYAGRFITTGAAVQNAYVEAETLKQLLVDKGVPEADVFPEPLAQHTDENIYYSTKIMEAQGWESALVVSDDPGHLVMTAICDSNCCVDLGRLTVVSLPVAGGSVVAGHYARYPFGEAVQQSECDLIEQPLKLMCVNLASRKACKDNFQL